MIFPSKENAVEAAEIHLLLRLGQLHYRVHGAGGFEVAPCPPYAAVPGGAAWFLGVVLHKGEALPLVDPGIALDPDGTRMPDTAGRMLVARHGGVSLALLVDDVDADDGRDDALALDLDGLTRQLLAAVAETVA